MARAYRSVLLAAVLAAVVPSAACALTVLDPTGTPIRALQAWADRSSLPLPDGTVSIRRGCGDVAGWYINGSRTVCVADRSEPATFLHEMFHLADFEAGENWRRIRERFITIHGLAGRGWEDTWWLREWGLHASPKEWFAEAASWCAATPRVRWRSEAPWIVTEFTYGFEPTRGRWLATCLMLSTELARS